MNQKINVLKAYKHFPLDDARRGRAVNDTKGKHEMHHSKRNCFVTWGETDCFVYVAHFYFVNTECSRWTAYWCYSIFQEFSLYFARSLRMITDVPPSCRRSYVLTIHGFYVFGSMILYPSHQLIEMPSSAFPRHHYRVPTSPLPASET